MPVLKSPEVTITPFSSGLMLISQEKRAEQPEEEDNSDVGVNDPVGLNVLCHSILVIPGVTQGDCAASIRFSLQLTEQWAQKGDFIARMKDEHGVVVQEHPSPFNSEQTALYVFGQSDISKLCGELVKSFAETSHDGADIRRRIANNALLIHAESVVAAKVMESQNRAPTFNWVKAINEGVETLGWRP